MAEGTDLGKEAKRYMDAGELVPDAVVVGMIRDRLADAGDEGFLLDGFPRSVPQADALDATLAELSLPLDAVLSIAVSRDELVRRLAGPLDLPPLRPLVPRGLQPVPGRPVPGRGRALRPRTSATTTRPRPSATG